MSFAVNEFQLIYKYFANWSGVGLEPALGIGDDAALVHLDSGRELVVAADTLVAGRHFPEGADASQIASRALRVNLSDLAAMGADPLHYTLCLTLPESDSDWLEAFAFKLRRESEQFGCSLIGGDTTRGGLCISLQMLGTAKKGSSLKRSAALPGDDIWVTGCLGDAAGSTADGFSAVALADAFWSPEPRLQYAASAKQYMHACIDVSDGLVADLGHICSASDVGADIQLTAIPLSSQLLALFPDKAQQFALSGGDDYELCFTASVDSKARLQQIAAEQKLQLTKIGNIRSGSGVDCLDDEGSAITINDAGYCHF